MLPDEIILMHSCKRYLPFRIPCRHLLFVWYSWKKQEKDVALFIEKDSALIRSLTTSFLSLVESKCISKEIVECSTPLNTSMAELYSDSTSTSLPSSSTADPSPPSPSPSPSLSPSPSPSHSPSPYPSINQSVNTNVARNEQISGMPPSPQYQLSSFTASLTSPSSSFVSFDCNTLPTSSFSHFPISASCISSLDQIHPLLSECPSPTAPSSLLSPSVKSPFRDEIEESISSSPPNEIIHCLSDDVPILLFLSRTDNNDPIYIGSSLPTNAIQRSEAIPDTPVLGGRKASRRRTFIQNKETTLKRNRNIPKSSNAMLPLSEDLKFSCPHVLRARTSCSCLESLNCWKCLCLNPVHKK